MQYMLLIYGNDTEWEQRSDEEKAAIYGEYGRLRIAGHQGRGRAAAGDDRDHRARERKRRDADDRRPVRRLEGGARRLLPVRGRRPGCGDRHRSANPRGADGGGRGAPGGGALIDDVFREEWGR